MTVDRQMRRYSVPRVAFINKCDRSGADPYKVGGRQLTVQPSRSPQHFSPGAFTNQGQTSIVLCVHNATHRPRGQTVRPCGCCSHAGSLLRRQKHSPPASSYALIITRALFRQATTAVLFATPTFPTICSMPPKRPAAHSLRQSEKWMRRWSLSFLLLPKFSLSRFACLAAGRHFFV